MIAITNKAKQRYLLPYHGDKGLERYEQYKILLLWIGEGEEKYSINEESTTRITLSGASFEGKSVKGSL